VFKYHHRTVYYSIVLVLNINVNLSLYV